jgi:hypothetical protein
MEINEKIAFINRGDPGLNASNKEFAPQTFYY